MTNPYAKLHRTAIRALLCLAALGCVPVAHAINKGQMGQFRYTPSGNSITIKPNQTGSSGSVSGIADMRGSIGTPIGMTGWYRGGNAPGSSTPGTMNMSHNGDVFFSGTKYPFQAGYTVPTKTVIEALGMLCKNPIICIGLSAASPAITSWLAEGNVGINKNEADYPDKPFTVVRDQIGTEYRVGQAPWASTRPAACSAFLRFELDAAWSCGSATVSKDGTTCSGKCTRNDGLKADRSGSFESRQATSGATYPASMDDIAPYMTPREVPANVVRDLLDKGVEIPLPSSPTVAGPETVQGPKEVTKNPDGSTTTHNTVYNFRTDGNRITNTSTTTTTQTCVGDGTCSPVTTTTTEDPKEPEQSDCEKNPDATRCKDIDLDTPDGEIPKADKDVSYQAESLFGGGSCPADKVMTIHTGQQLTVWNWQESCGYITNGMRPVVLILCGFAAFMIVSGGARQ